MTIEVKVISVGTEEAVIGVGPTTELLWVAGKVLFFDLGCGYQDTCFSCFSKLNICLYGVLFYFAMKRLKKKIHTQIWSCHCSVKTLQWPHSACKEKFKLFHMVDKALQHLLLYSKPQSMLTILNFQFLKSTLLYVTVSNYQLLLRGTIKHTLFLPQLANSYLSFRPQ